MPKPIYQQTTSQMRCQFRRFLKHIGKSFTTFKDETFVILAGRIVQVTFRELGRAKIFLTRATDRKVMINLDLGVNTEVELLHKLVQMNVLSDVVRPEQIRDWSLNRYASALRNGYKSPSNKKA